MIRYLLHSVALYIIYLFGYTRRRRPFLKKKQQSNGEAFFSSSVLEKYEIRKARRITTMDRKFYQKIEELVARMCHKIAGVCMSTTVLPNGIVPPVFHGKDLIAWMIANMESLTKDRALYLANVLFVHGYIFSVDRYHLKVENNNNYYRFQSPQYWFTNISDPNEFDYAIYLAKRSREKNIELRLDDYEKENLIKLKAMCTDNWIYIIIKTESDLYLAKKQNNWNEKQKLDDEERAFWNVHRPNPDTEHTLKFDYFLLLSYKEINFWNIENETEIQRTFTIETVRAASE